jgi:Zn-dependent protease with chaperone function
MLSRSIAPAALFLRLFVVALAGGPLVGILVRGRDLTEYPYLVLALLALGTMLWGSVVHRLPLAAGAGGQLLRPAPLVETRPVAGWAKLLALLALEEPVAIRSLTGRSVVAVSPTTTNPMLWDQRAPSRGRLLLEALSLLTIAGLWGVAVSGVSLNLGPYPFAGLALAVGGTGSALLTLLQRFGWGAGGYPIDGLVWAAPLIPSQGPNRFRAMISPTGRRILLRPDLLREEYLPYLLAHERAHLELRSARGIWLETLTVIAILVGSGLALARWGAVGALPLLLLLPLRLLVFRLSFRSELAADERAARALGAASCLAALERLAAQWTAPPPLPRWRRYSPSYEERIDHLKQRFRQT